MLLCFVNQQTVFEKIEYYFSVRGHSYLPPDRVFGRIEQKLRRIEKIMLPDQYHDIFKMYAHVYLLNQDWHISDFKELSQRLLKNPLPFPISTAKVLCLQKSKMTIGLKVSYNGDFKWYNNITRLKVTNLKGVKPKVYASVSHVSKE